MTILLENAPMSCQMNEQIESVQMLLPEEQAMVLNYSET